MAVWSTLTQENYRDPWVRAAFFDATAAAEELKAAEERIASYRALVRSLCFRMRTARTLLGGRFDNGQLLDWHRCGIAFHHYRDAQRWARIFRRRLAQIAAGAAATVETDLAAIAAPQRAAAE